MPREKSNATTFTISPASRLFSISPTPNYLLLGKLRLTNPSTLLTPSSVTASRSPARTPATMEGSVLYAVISATRTIPSQAANPQKKDGRGIFLPQCGLVEHDFHEMCRHIIELRLEIFILTCESCAEWRQVDRFSYLIY